MNHESNLCLYERLVQEKPMDPYSMALVLVDQSKKRKQGISSDTSKTGKLWGIREADEWMSLARETEE